MLILNTLPGCINWGNLVWLSGKGLDGEKAKIRMAVSYHNRFPVPGGNRSGHLYLIPTEGRN
jgi:hypothetical protein